MGFAARNSNALPSCCRRCSPPFLDAVNADHRTLHAGVSGPFTLPRQRMPPLLQPERRIYANFEDTPNTEVAIYSRPLQDIYAIVGGSDPDTGKIVLKIMLNPLVQMVWIGGFILVIGTLITIRPSKAERKLKGILT